MAREMAQPADELKQIKAKKWENGLSLVQHNEQSADIAVFLSQRLQRLCVLTLLEQMRVSRARKHNDSPLVCPKALLPAVGVETQTGF